MNDPVTGYQKELLCTMTPSNRDVCCLDMKLDAKEIVKNICYLATKKL